MEVFLRNLDPSSSDRALRNQLKPAIKALSIQKFHCEKPRKKKYGFVTFLLKEDGQKFLDRHGEIPHLRGTESNPIVRNAGLGSNLFSRQRPRRDDRPECTARLTLLGRQVFCKESDRQVDPITLRGLENAPESLDVAAEGTETAYILFNDVVRFGCGHYAISQGAPAFMSEWAVLVQGTAKFTRKALILRLSHRAEIQIRIPLQTIFELVVMDDGNMVLTLTTPRSSCRVWRISKPC